jgi:hypothetical protein
VKQWFYVVLSLEVEVEVPLSVHEVADRLNADGARSAVEGWVTALWNAPAFAAIEEGELLLHDVFDEDPEVLLARARGML